MAVLAALIAPLAAAETLIYVTDTTIGTVDSANPSTDTTSSNKNNGPLNYSLPNGSTAIGAEVSLENQTLYLLATNSGSCQLYSVDTSGSNGTAALTAVDSSYACSPAAGSGDFTFVNYSGSTSVTDAYLVAEGSDVLEVPAGGGAPTAYAVSNPAGSSGNVWALADEGTSAGDILLYGVDAGTQQLFQLNLNSTAQTASETNVTAAPVTFSGSTSFDYSTSSGTLYLYTGGELYAYGGVPYPNNLSSGALAILGKMPGGTLAMAVANGASITNNSGAMSPATLLPLLALAGLRRRRARRA
jgi:hypothetical protein